MKHRIHLHFIFFILTFAFSVAGYGQGARNIKVNEVLTVNKTSIEDKYGNHLPWVELVNASYSTYNVRDMYITTDRRVLNKELSAPERISMMSIIPSGDDCTLLSGKSHLLLFLNSNSHRGTQHMHATVENMRPNWIALYDANGIDLIDSVTIPVLSADESFARKNDGAEQWVVKPTDQVTAETENFAHVSETKSARLKRDDPHGFGITVLSMTIVFSCLALLYVFFSLFGIYMKRKQAKKVEIEKRQRREIFLRHKDKLRAEALAESENKEKFMAVIAMALKEYQDNQHDEESGIITIRPKHTSWVHIAQETEKNYPPHNLHI